MALGLAAIALTLTWSVVAQQVSVPSDRWLEIRQIVGTVLYAPAGQPLRPAQNSARLQRVGDTVQTGPRSSAVLAVDTGVGFVNVAENTILRVQQLQVVADGGRVTRLEVTQGQVRLQVRSFNRSGSRLEIQTPAGISGVRGTTFGVAIHPDGKTGVATLEGQIAATAQAETVLINPEFQSLIVPGEPPTPPEPLRNDTRLNLRRLVAVDAQTAEIVGQIDPVNFLIIAGVPRIVEDDGRFRFEVPLSAARRIAATVITPLGIRQEYELAVP